jgi:hypothetical protein
MTAGDGRETAATPGQAAHTAFVEARFPHLDRAHLAWQKFTDDERATWEAAAQAARDHRGVLTPGFPPEDAYSPEETAYEALTARLGPKRIAWEALDPGERADWRAVVRALAKRKVAEPQPAPELAEAPQAAEGGPYAGLGPYGIAVTALERILELDSGWMSWDEARAIASEALAVRMTGMPCWLCWTRDKRSESKNT